GKGRASLYPGARRRPYERAGHVDFARAVRALDLRAGDGDHGCDVVLVARLRGRRGALRSVGTELHAHEVRPPRGRVGGPGIGGIGTDRNRKLARGYPSQTTRTASSTFPKSSSRSFS